MEETKINTKRVTRIRAANVLRAYLHGDAFRKRYQHLDVLTQVKIEQEFHAIISRLEEEARRSDEQE